MPQIEPFMERKKGRVRNCFSCVTPFNCLQALAPAHTLLRTVASDQLNHYYTMFHQGSLMFTSPAHLSTIMLTKLGVAMFNHLVCILANSVYEQAQALLTSNNKKGVAKYVSVKKGVAKYVSVKKGVAKYVSVKKGVAKYVSVNKGVAKYVSVKKGVAKYVSVKKGVAKYVSVKKGVAKYVSVKKGVAKYVYVKKGVVKYVSVKKGVAKYVSVKKGVVKYVSVKKGVAKYVSVKKGVVKYVSVKKGVAKYVSVLTFQPVVNALSGYQCLTFILTSTQRSTLALVR